MNRRTSGLRRARGVSRRFGRHYHNARIDARRAVGFIPTGAESKARWTEIPQ